MRSILMATLCLTLPSLVNAQASDVYNPSEPVVSEAPSQLTPVQPEGTMPVLFTSGPFVTSSGTGPGGSDISLLQNGTLGLTTLGATCTGAFSLADDFVVPAGQTWNMTGARFHGYQTGSPTSPSTFTAVSFQILNGRPGDVGTTVLFGDLTTNRFASSAWSNAYRTAEGAVGTTRPVMTTVANVGSPITLTAGTYWIEFRLTGSGASGPFCPPISIIGQTTTGNAVQGNAGAYAPFNDGGTMTPQGVPFSILGNIAQGQLGVSSSALTFGSQQVGFSSNQTLTLSNIGNGPLSITNLAGPSAPFSIVGGTCGATPISIAPGTGCTIQVRYTPTANGNSNGSIVITTSLPSTTTVTLSGTGVVVNTALIPVNSNWALFALFGVLLSLGVFAVARRGS